MEESGYEAEEFILWDSQHPISKIDWVVYTFIAKGLKKVTDLHLDAGEKIKLLPVTLEKLIDIATDGHENFYEKEVIVKFFEAKLNPEKMKELRELFKPLEK